MKDLKRVYITQDYEGHEYVLPYELKDEFIELSILSNGVMSESGLEESDIIIFNAINDFNVKFSQYATEGDINLIELYAKI